NLFHWQVRARYHKNSTDYYSAWQSYPDTSNPETDTDLIVDTTAPAITFTPTDTCSGGQSSPGSNSITINWGLNESGDGQVQYSRNSDLSASVNYPLVPQAAAFTHSLTLANLDSGVTYYYRVKSRDAAHNLGQKPASPYCSFTTSSVTQPAKTAEFDFMGATGAVTALATTSFSVIIPESAISIKSAFLEITGLASGGSNPITVQVNGAGSRSYDVNAASPTPFRFVYQISSPQDETNLNLNNAAPCSYGHLHNSPCNQLSVTPGSGMTVNINSAKLIVTYGYSQ
ncbi:MAG TPA: fibronectin type III domain-containing protein, partial [Candidatus Methylomirabilis sp.]|nr:fibronectin type III domain-containing protein [Candidatus Methylomirabilis sp.]